MDKPTFKSNKERIDWLIANKSELIEMKRASLKFTDLVTTPTNETTIKALNTSYKDDPTSGVIKRDIIANTYNWLDSHGDGANKVFHLHDHKHEVTAKVGKFESIQEVAVQWSDLGVNKQGTTTVLLAKSDIKEGYNKDVFKQYLEGEIDQHSVGMRYIKLDLAVNDEDYKEEYAEWNKYINEIGNKEEAEELGYFWAVKEAVLIEVSAVLMGSNELTPTIENIEPLKNTQKQEPSKDTQIDWNKVINNF
jgi:hypothetical protein